MIVYDTTSFSVQLELEHCILGKGMGGVTCA